MISLKEYICEAKIKFKMDTSLLSEYNSIIKSLKEEAAKSGMKLKRVPSDSTTTLYLCSKNDEILFDFISTSKQLFDKQKEENWPLPYSNCDVDVDYDTFNIPSVWFLMWLNLGPCENPLKQYKEAYECYATDDSMEEDWVSRGFDNPDNYLEALIGQGKDLLKIFDKLNK